MRAWLVHLYMWTFTVNIAVCAEVNVTLTPRMAILDSSVAIECIVELPRMLEKYPAFEIRYKMLHIPRPEPSNQSEPNYHSEMPNHDDEEPHISSEMTDQPQWDQDNRDLEPNDLLSGPYSPELDWSFMDSTDQFRTIATIRGPNENDFDFDDRFIKNVTFRYILKGLVFVAYVRLNHVTYSTTGTYKCRSIFERQPNDSGYYWDSRPVDLVVSGSGAPEIGRYGMEPLKRMGQMSKPLKLTCLFWSCPLPLSLQWVLPDGSNTSKMISSESMPCVEPIGLYPSLFSYNIPYVKKKHAGNYTCVVSNEIEQSLVTMAVSVDPFVAIQEKDFHGVVTKYVHLSNGRIVTDMVLRCVAANFDFPNNITFQWYYTKDNRTQQLFPGDEEDYYIEEIQVSEIFQPGEPKESILHIMNGLTYSPVGNYTCRASSQEGNYTDTVMLDIEGSPYVRIVNGSYIDAQPGMTLTLVCEVKANPAVTDAAWEPTLRPVDFSRFFYNSHEENNTIYIALTLRDIEVSDLNHKYGCLARNKYGSRIASIKLGLNECALNLHNCSDECIDEEAGYRCACTDKDEILGSDSRTCIEMDKKDEKDIWILGVGVSLGAVGVLLLIGAGILAFCCLRMRKKKKERDTILKLVEEHAKKHRGKQAVKFTNSAPEFQELARSLSRLALSNRESSATEFPKERIKLLEVIGTGRFGQVWAAQALNIIGTGKWEAVAIKMCKDFALDNEKADFLNELNVMSSIPRHMNVVNYLGCSTTSDPAMLIMEYITGGDLQSYLRQRRGLTSKDRDECDSGIWTRLLWGISQDHGDGQMRNNVDLEAADGGGEITKSDDDAVMTTGGEREQMKKADDGGKTRTGKTWVHQRTMSVLGNDDSSRCEISGENNDIEMVARNLNDIVATSIDQEENNGKHVRINGIINPAYKHDNEAEKAVEDKKKNVARQLFDDLDLHVDKAKLDFIRNHEKSLLEKDRKKMMATLRRKRINSTDSKKHLVSRSLSLDSDRSDVTTRTMSDYLDNLSPTSNFGTTPPSFAAHKALCRTYARMSSSEPTLLYSPSDQDQHLYGHQPGTLNKTTSDQNVDNGHASKKKETENLNAAKSDDRCDDTGGLESRVDQEVYPKDSVDYNSHNYDVWSHASSSVSRHGSLRRLVQHRHAPVMSDSISLAGAGRRGVKRSMQKDRISRRSSHVIGSDVSYISETDLEEYLLSSSDLFAFGLQIARGMRHLAENDIIHRDLAARNVLVTDQGICKIADFGLARVTEGEEVYERKSQGPLPIRWMAPESLTDAKHSKPSDVWSYGILLWEIVTLGASPYPGLSAKEVFKFVTGGKKMERPKHCTVELYDLMCQCWTYQATKRPTFAQLCERLEELLEKETDYIDLEQFRSEDYQVMERDEDVIDEGQQDKETDVLY